MRDRIFPGIWRGVALFAFASALAGGGAALAQAATTTETLVFVRHGEKPVDVDNGQLTCQGFNRSLALAPLLLSRYGIPNYLFAAAPVKNQDDNGVDYYYLRALATIEPTAVAAGKTINLNYARDQIDDVEKELMKPAYQSAIVFVAWEHTLMDELAANILQDNGGNASVVPAWPSNDFDSIFVITLVRAGSQTLATFTHDQEGLDNQSASCASGQSYQRRPPMPQPPIRPTPISGLSHASLTTRGVRAPT